MRVWSIWDTQLLKTLRFEHNLKVKKLKGIKFDTIDPFAVSSFKGLKLFRKYHLMFFAILLSLIIRSHI